jgi:hypothetical protein
MCTVKRIEDFVKIRCGFCSLEVVEKFWFSGILIHKSLLGSLSNHSQHSRDILKGAIVHAQTCPCMH